MGNFITSKIIKKKKVKCLCRRSEIEVEFEVSRIKNEVGTKGGECPQTLVHELDP